MAKATDGQTHRQTPTPRYNPPMIGYLRGTLHRARPEVALLDVGGVGYELHISLNTFSELEAAGQGSEVEVFVHTHVWSDGMALYGFTSERERSVFERLLGVSGIGPRLARVILSGMAPDDLVSALASRDVGRLTTIPGVGKKSAERMVLELKDKMDDLAAEVATRPAAPTAASEDRDLVSALVNLGYRQNHAEKAVGAAREEHPDAPFHDVLRAALRRLSRSV